MGVHVDGPNALAVDNDLAPLLLRLRVCRARQAAANKGKAGQRAGGMAEQFSTIGHCPHFPHFLRLAKLARGGVSGTADRHQLAGFVYDVNVYETYESAAAPHRPRHGRCGVDRGAQIASPRFCQRGGS